MKKLLMTSLTALTLIAGTSVFAAEAPAVEKEKAPTEKTAIKKEENKTENKAENKAADSTVNLYESPEANSKIIKKLPVFSNLVGIYQQGDWLKVGDRADGSTGWINISQYNAAKNNYYRSSFQMMTDSVYLRAEKNDKGQTEVVAYKDGKKLTPAEAKTLYDHMQTQEQKQWQAMQRFNQMMDEQMQSVFQMPLMMPQIVVVDEPVAQTEKTEKTEKPQVKSSAN